MRSECFDSDIAVGTDILCIDRIKRILEGEDSWFLDNLFSKDEQEAALNRPVPLHYYATRFAGKEAVIKTLSRCKGDFSFSEIEILSAPDGAPYVKLSGKTQKLAEGNYLKGISISLSYDTGYAVAFAIAEFDSLH